MDRYVFFADSFEFMIQPLIFLYLLRQCVNNPFHQQAQGTYAMVNAPLTLLVHIGRVDISHTVTRARKKTYRIFANPMIDLNMEDGSVETYRLVALVVSKMYVISVSIRKLTVLCFMSIMGRR